METFFQHTDFLWPVTVRYVPKSKKFVLGWYFVTCHNGHNSQKLWRCVYVQLWPLWHSWPVTKWQGFVTTVSGHKISPQNKLCRILALYVYLCRTANMSWRTCVVVAQIQSNPVQSLRSSPACHNRNHIYNLRSLFWGGILWLVTVDTSSHNQYPHYPLFKSSHHRLCPWPGGGQVRNAGLQVIPAARYYLSPPSGGGASR